MRINTDKTKPGYFVVQSALIGVYQWPHMD